MRHVVALLFLAACAGDPEPRETLGAVCTRIATAACVRAAACTPPLPGDVTVCIDGYVVACCGEACDGETWTAEAGVGACVEAYGAYACELVPVRPPDACGVENLAGGR